MFLPFTAPQESPQKLEPGEILREELRAVLSELRQIDAEARDLRTRYRLRIDGLLQIVGMEADMREAETVRVSWRTLQQRARPLLTRFHELEKQIAEEKKLCPQI